VQNQARLESVTDNPGVVDMTLTQVIDAIGERLETNGSEAEKTDRFAFANYDLLREHKIFSSMVPAELGGGGRSYREVSAMLATLAGYHPSTALSCSMHQHIIAANRYNHVNGKPGRALLEKVAANELVLVSTGAGDWLASNGEATRVDGGYRVTATKHFASGSVAGDMLVTSAPYHDPGEGWLVLHFPVPLKAEGVTVLDNWRAMGMRGTGSNSVSVKDVFVPDDAVAARRPRGDYHAMWSVVLPVALPLIMSAYLGVARKAAERARARCKKSIDPVTPYVLGEMENALTTAEMALESMLSIVGEFEFTADLGTVNEIVKRKTIAANACKEVTAKAVEACGGPGFLRDNGIENLFRDSMASHFHPMQEKRQHLFTGSLSMDREPPGQAF